MSRRQRQAPNDAGNEARDARVARLAAALRANLVRRKAQARAADRQEAPQAEDDIAGRE